MSVVFITHDMGVVAEIADRVVVMWKGRSVEEGLAAQVLTSPRHPYTQALLAAVPRLGSMKGEAEPKPFPEPQIAEAASPNSLPFLEGAGIGERHAASPSPPAAVGQASRSRSAELGRPPRANGEDRAHDDQASASNSSRPVLEVANLVTRFPIRSGVFGRVSGRVHAVENVSFSLRAGETLALVGESGC